MAFINEVKPESVFVSCANLDHLDRLFAQIKKRKGKLDILFANARTAKDTPLGTSTEELFDGGIAQV